MPRALNLPSLIGAGLLAGLVLFACTRPGVAADAGEVADAGADAAAQVGCSVDVPRSAALEAFAGPAGLEQRLVDELDAAKDSIEVMMYLFTLDRFVEALADAKGRGVAVRVLLDPEHPGNGDARAALAAAGVQVRDGPAMFTHSHSKVLIIDGRRAVIMSSNLNQYSMTAERNYGVIDTDPEDVADVRAVFESDWSGEDYPDLSCTRLLVSPVNARKRILDHINGAGATLDAALMYIADETIRNALIQRHQAGVAVRVLLADPGWVADNVDTAAELSGAGIEVRFLETLQLHAKLIIADGRPFVGSQNMSFTSLNRNREIGLVVTGEQPAAEIGERFEADWGEGASP